MMRLYAKMIGLRKRVVGDEWEDAHGALRAAGGEEPQVLHLSEAMLSKKTSCCGQWPCVVEKIEHPRSCASRSRFDPCLQVQIWTESTLGQNDPLAPPWRKKTTLLAA